MGAEPAASDGVVASGVDAPQDARTSITVSANVRGMLHRRPRFYT